MDWPVLVLGAVADLRECCIAFISLYMVSTPCFFLFCCMAKILCLLSQFFLFSLAGMYEATWCLLFLLVYTHFYDVLSRYYDSSGKYSESHILFALSVNVLIVPLFCDRWWLESWCRYLSACVSFLYFLSLFMSASKNAIDFSGSISMVNRILRLIEFR